MRDRVLGDCNDGHDLVSYCDHHVTCSVDPATCSGGVATYSDDLVIYFDDPATCCDDGATCFWSVAEAISCGHSSSCLCRQSYY